jgi:serine/threonine-protein kinase
MSRFDDATLDSNPSRGPDSGAVSSADSGADSSAAPTPRTVGLLPGSILASRYRVERFVDEGGAAQIFEATNLELDERVALKLAHPIYRSSPDLIARFRGEARALARIRSEHVARVFDVVTTDAGDLVMVMELLEGENLETILHRRALPPLIDAIGWVLEACSGLAVAHANGIVHRDIKPANIFIANVFGGGRVVKVLDFGISRLALSGQKKSSISGPQALVKLLGTPDYMAPEQVLSSKAADPRIDIWSLGVVLFELLTNERPFAGATIEKLCAQVVQGKAPDVRSRRPDIDPELAGIVNRCLRKDPNDRFPSVADLAVALLPFGPRKHEISVDQTIGVLKAAGLTTIDFPMVLSLRAPTVDSSRPARAQEPSSTAPAASATSVERAASIAPASDASSNTTALPPTAGTMPPSSPNRSSRNFVVGGVALLLAAAAGAYAMGLFRHAEPPATAATASVLARFDTDPSGATIEVDGAFGGMSPASLNLLPGRHLLTITKPGFDKLSTVVDVTPKSADNVARFLLVPAGGGDKSDAPAADKTAAKPAVDAGRPTGNLPAPRGDSTQRPADSKPTAPGAPNATAAGPAVTPPPAATPKPTVKVIDDNPSTTRVIN